MDSNTQEDGGQDTGTKKTRKTGMQSENDTHTPTDTAGTSGKKKGRSKKKTLTFEVEQAQDSENIFEGTVQENIEDVDLDNDKDGSYSVEGTGHEYEHFAIPTATGMDIDTDNGLGLSTKDLADEGFIQLTGFQSNSAFNSLQNSPVNKREPLPSDSPWRKGEQRPNMEPPAHPKPAEYEPRSPTGTPADHEPRPATGTSAQARPPASPVMNNKPVPNPSSSRQEKPVIISSDDEGNESEYTMTRKEVEKLLNDETRVRTEVLADLGAMTPAETIVVRAFAHGQTTKAFERLGFTEIPSDSEEFIVEYNANLATILIGRSFLSPECAGEKSTLSTLSFAKQKDALRKRMEKGKKKPKTCQLHEEIIVKERDIPQQAENKSTRPKMREPEQPKVKIETTGKKIPSWEEDEMRAIKEKVTLQRIRNSQLRDGMKPTVPDQGIIFDENNNPWLKPDFAYGNTQTRESSMGHKVHTRGGGPPDDGDGPDDEDDDNPGNGKRDPFTPRPWPRGTSMTPSSRSIEAKTRDQECRYQKIIEFICANLEKRLQIPDGLKPPRWDAKTMTKYGGSELKDIFWQWLKSVVFAYRSSQLGGPERDEERVLILDLLLEDKAKLWFQERISRLTEPKPTFVEVIVEMYRRFVNESAQQDARDAFKEAKWPDGDGRVQGWHDKIMRLVEDMDIAPDQYTIKEKFMEGLPDSIRMKVFADKMSIEYNSVDELVESALDAEYTVRTQKRFSKITRASRPGDRTEDADKGKNQTGDFRPRFSGYQKNKGFFKDSNQRESHQTGKERYTRTREDASPGKPKAEKEPRHDDGYVNTKHFTPKDKTAERQKQGPICYRCGGIGHVAANEICPEYGKKPTQAQIRAAHTIIMGSMEGMEDDEVTYESEEDNSTSTCEQEEFDTLEFEEYDGFSEEGNEEEMDKPEHTQAMYVQPPSPTHEKGKEDSDDEVVYGRSAGETMREIPLFEFGGPIPEEPTQPTRTLRMAVATELRPEETTKEATEEPKRGLKTFVRVLKDPGTRPTHNEKRCLVTYLNVNGLDALTLWDSGSTSTAMSPPFADVSKALVFRLTNPVVLQLGTVGSRSRINFGTKSNIVSDGYTGPGYFDVVNIDKYNVIIGTPFMHEHGVVLDFKTKCIRIGNVTIPAKIIDGKEADLIARRHCLRRPEPPRQ